jgi:hypothetical protein
LWNASTWKTRLGLTQRSTPTTASRDTDGADALDTQN